MIQNSFSRRLGGWRFRKDMFLWQVLRSRSGSEQVQTRTFSCNPDYQTWPMLKDSWFDVCWFFRSIYQTCWCSKLPEYQPANASCHSCHSYHFRQIFARSCGSGDDGASDAGVQAVCAWHLRWIFLNTSIWSIDQSTSKMKRGNLFRRFSEKCFLWNSVSAET